METIKRDIRHGARLLLKQPGFTLAALAVLALGIGANTAMFSLVNAFLLKPLAIQKPEQLVGVYSRDAAKNDSYRGFSYGEYAELAAHQSVFSSVLAHNVAMVGVADSAAGGDGDRTRRVFADIVTANYFQTFGVAPRGRAFTAEEERPGSAIPVAIVSHSFWKRSGASPAMLGSELRVNGQVYTVVGIAPEGFGGTTALISSELYLPMGMYEALVNDFGGGRSRALAAADNYALIVVGRLREGLSREAADAQLSATVHGEGAEARNFVVRQLSRLSISTSPSSDDELRTPSLLLQSMAAIVLLIASLNVANMMLARGSARRKEIAIRVAMGASRRSVLLQLCTEGLLLALLGGAAGLAVAYWSTTVLVRSLAGLAPVDLVFAAGPDLRVLAATMAFCLLSTLLFSFGPAWSLSRPDVFADLKGKEQESSGRGRRGLFSRRNLLVVGQLALSLMLLTAAGLFIRSALQAARMAPGFQVDDSLVIEVDPSLAGYDAAHTRELYRQLLPRLRAVPGVASADLAATVPFGMVSLGRGVQRASDPPLSKADASSDSRKRAGVVEASFNIVGEDYFKTLGVAVLRGRAFESRETSGAGSAVVILDKLAAEALFPKADPIGQRVRMVGDGLDAAGEAEVVGVVGSVQQHILGTAWSPHLYVPFGQEVQSDMTLHVRAMAQGREAPDAMTKEAQAALLDAVRREIRAVDPRLPVLAARSLAEHLEGSFDLWLARTAARMFTLFGGVALLLAVIGLYGVRAYAVARRTREIGIRMAIGASAGDALRLVFREGAALTALGLGGGLVLSIALGKLLSGMLYQVSGFDPLVLASAPAALAAVSLLACWIPARKAARTDPMVALRDE